MWKYRVTMSDSISVIKKIGYFFCRSCKANIINIIYFDYKNKGKNVFNEKCH